MNMNKKFIIKFFLEVNGNDKGPCSSFCGVLRKGVITNMCACGYPRSYHK